MKSELRQAWRSIQARRALAVTVVLSLAIGIGANAMLFAIIDGAVLRPFPFPESDRLLGVGAAFPKLRAPLDFFEVLSGPEYKEIKDGAQGLARIAGFDLGNEPVTVGDTPERAFTAYLWDDLFATLGMAPSRGRAFTQAEIAGAAPVAIVSYAFWQERLGAAGTVIGTKLAVGGRPHEIVGVMPPRTRIYGTDLWVPMPDRAETLPRGRRQFNVLARLAPGATLDEANASLSLVARRMEEGFGAAVPEYEGFMLAARKWADIEVWGGTQVATAAFGALGLLLLLAASNLTNLLLVRATARRREMALRLALGASRSALARQVLIESLLQAGAGALLGCALALIGIRILPAWLPGFLPEDASIGFSGRMLTFAAALALATAAVVWLPPALQLTRSRPSGALGAEVGRLAGSRRARRIQFAVVAVEVAIAVVVSGAAALLTANTWAKLRVDPGFDVQRLAIMRLTLPLPKYGGHASMQFFDRLLERTRALPSVEYASLSNQPPPGLFSRTQFAIDGRAQSGDGSLPSAFFTTAGSAYRETIGLRLKRGRWLDEGAERTGPREVVINESAVARFFPREDPVGRRLRIVRPASDGAWANVVGVVADIRNRGLVPDPAPEIIGNVRQIPERRQSQLYLVVRGRASTESIVQDIRRVVTGLDPQQPLYAITTVELQFQNGVGPRLSAARVLVAFGILALAIAGFGVYAVLSHAVGERTREIGVRLALGAPVQSVRRMVARQAMIPVCLGIATGLLAVSLGARVLSSWIFGVRPEPIALSLAAAALCLVGLAASALPAWRASRLNPVAALRSDSF